MMLAEVVKMGTAIRSLTDAPGSLDVVVDGRRLSAPYDLKAEVFGAAQARIGFERAVGAGHVEAVDGSEHVAVLEAEASEQAVAADAVHLDAHDAASLLVGNDARGAHQLALVGQDLVDEAALHVEVGVAHAADAGLHVGGADGAAGRVG